MVGFFSNLFKVYLFDTTDIFYLKLLVGDYDSLTVIGDILKLNYDNRNEKITKNKNN